MKRQKTFHLAILAICLLCGLVFALPVKARAASFKQFEEGDKKKVGKYYIWVDDTGEKICVSKSKSGKGSVAARAKTGRKINDCLSNGSVIYYGEKPESGKNAYTYIYSVKANGKSKKYIGKVKNCTNIAAYYKNRLYVECSDSRNPIPGLYSLDIKKGKCRRVGKEAIVIGQYKQYLVTMGDYEGPMAYNTYDCKTGKFVRITKKGNNQYSINMDKGKIYYAEKVSGTKLRIRSCSMSGKDQETVGTLEIEEKPGTELSINVQAITSKCVYYEAYYEPNDREDGEEVTQYYCYDYKAQKSTKMNAKKFNKVVSAVSALVDSLC